MEILCGANECRHNKNGKCRLRKGLRLGYLGMVNTAICMNFETLGSYIVRKQIKSLKRKK